MSEGSSGASKRPFGVWLYCEAPNQKRNEFVNALATVADALRVAEAKQPDVDQRRKAGHPANVSIRIGGKIILWSSDTGFTGQGAVIASAEKDGKPIASIVEPLEKKAEEMRRVERVERAARRLREVSDKIDPADPKAVVTAYIDSRRRCGVLWNKMMERLGVSMDAEPEIKAKARQDAMQLDIYGEYIEARKIRDATVVVIDADRKAHISHLEDTRIDQMALDADIRAAFKDVNRDAVAQQRADAKTAGKAAGTPAGSPSGGGFSATSRSTGGPSKDDLSRYDGVTLLTKRPINGGVMGSVRIKEREVGFVAFGKGADAIGNLDPGTKLNILAGPNPRKPDELRVVMVFTGEDRRGGRS